MLKTLSAPKAIRTFGIHPTSYELSAGIPWQQKGSPIPAKFSGFNNFLSPSNGANLQGVSLTNADLRWTNFRGAKLRKANLSSSVLWGAILTNADLKGADLSHADLTGVDLVGADLTNATVEGTCFLGARFGQSTRFPKQFGDPEKKGMVSLNESMQLS